MGNSTKVFWVFIVLFLAGCQGDDRLKEKARIEAGESASRQAEIEKARLAERAKEMEEDLSRRQRFYSGVAGTYEGAMQGTAGTPPMRLRIILSSSLPPYSAPRTRTLDEIAYDLNNLYFNAQAVFWINDGSGGDLAVGCVFDRIRPDLNTGQTRLSSTECANFFTLQLAENDSIYDPLRTTERDDQSTMLSKSLVDGDRSTVSALTGTRYVTRSSGAYYFGLKRTQ